jgi:diadenosine tetraphosphate (Ap4A) HIT family hydrolase
MMNAPPIIAGGNTSQFSIGPAMSSPLYACSGGQIVLPHLVLCDRQDGGHLIVNPPRPVWERSLLTPQELMHWSFLVAATGRAMLETLPVLQGGCLNYWEAGNWALNDQATPTGPKNPSQHRRVHLHVFGRSPSAKDTDWRWGESPKFPDFSDAATWACRFAPLTAGECQAITDRVAVLLATVYAAAVP